MPDKNAGSENFPVGSWLLSARLRPHVLTFYNFARAADNIADCPDLSRQQKTHRLEGFEKVLLGQAPGSESGNVASAMAESLAITGITPRYCRDLLAAFRQDAIKDRYDDWADLIAYCRLSAAPVGRYMIDLHGGPNGAYGPSDALCMALQIINHVQDCGDDYRVLNRVYLPADWLAEAGAGPDDLAAGDCSAALRRVLDWTLSAIANLLADSQPLGGMLKSRRLALESNVILAIAKDLNRKLGSNDPLARHVTLSPSERLIGVIRGIVVG